MTIARAGSLTKDRLRRPIPMEMAATAREVDLSPLRADGWFDRLGEDNESFAALCDIVGKHFVAFSIIAGVRITALTVDRRNPSATVVSFALAEGESEQQLTVGEFRRRIGASMLGDDPPVAVPTGALGPDEAQFVIGSRYLLLAPLFGYSLLKLVVPPVPAGETEPPTPIVGVFRDGFQEDVTVAELRERLRDGVQREIDAVQEGQFGLELRKVDDARVALDAGDAEKVIELLGNWPGPASLLLRTPMGVALDPNQRGTIALGLTYLGHAFIKVGRSAWAEELFRLGLQYVHEGEVAAGLFLGLGQAMAGNGRHGEAIAPLRRALALGAGAAAVYPALGRAFLDRGRFVAAAACFDAANAAGVDVESIRIDRDAAYQKLGEAGARWQKFTG